MVNHAELIGKVLGCLGFFFFFYFYFLLLFLKAAALLQSHCDFYCL